MIQVKMLSNAQEIEQACALLYDVYIEQGKWEFSLSNPSKLRVETRNNKKLLIDRFSEKSTWFAAFDKTKMVGCVRLSGLDESGFYEVEGYKSSQIIHQYLPRESCLEMGRVAVSLEYKGKKIVNMLYLKAFEYCESYKVDVFGCANNPFIRSLFKKIVVPLKIEQAFRYEIQDLLPVNFYFCDYKKGDLSAITYNLRRTLINNISERYNILEALEVVAPILPIPIYWHDTNGVVLGVNDHCLSGIGASRDSIVGKSPLAFHAKDVAERILKHNKHIMDSGKVSSQEEFFNNLTTEELVYAKAVKAPLYDYHGNVIGVIGSSIDITAEKEAAKLKLDKKSQEAAATASAIEQAKFREIVGRVAHDIQSPLASLQNIVRQTVKIPEADRTAIRSAISSISNIANNLLNQYTNKDNDYDCIQQEILLSALLEQVVNEKKYQYQDEAVKFSLNIPRNMEAVFIRGNSGSFRRMLSNLMNNAVEALWDTTDAVVTVSLSGDSEQVAISVRDNGCGMDEGVRDKILNNCAVTHGKDDGHGIGFRQINDTVEKSKGRLDIRLDLKYGTEITVSFPRIEQPQWLIKEVSVGSKDLVIILDDDDSIHNLWDSKFKPILMESDELRVMHFRTFYMALEHIKKLSDADKKNLTLLCDYELISPNSSDKSIKQNTSGLDLIRQVAIGHAILVTNHFDNLDVIKEAQDCKVKIIPKPLANNVKIVLDKGKNYPKDSIIKKRVDLVLLEPLEEVYSNILDWYCDKRIDHYVSADKLLESIDKYPKNSKICLSNDLGSISGIELAAKLYNLGYTKLSLFAGTRSLGDELPSYLNQVQRSNWTHFKKYILGDAYE